MSDQVRSYASYIGLDLDRYPELCWIAEEGLRCPLPHGWILVKQPDGSHYFQNTETNLSSVDHPLDQHYRDLAQKEMRSTKPNRRNSSPTRGQQQKKKSSKTIRYFVYGAVSIIALHFLISLTMFEWFMKGVELTREEKTISIVYQEKWQAIQNVCCTLPPTVIEVVKHVVSSDVQAAPEGAASPQPAAVPEAPPAEADPKPAAPKAKDVSTPPPPQQQAPKSVEAEEEESSWW